MWGFPTRLSTTSEKNLSDTSQIRRLHPPRPPTKAARVLENAQEAAAKWLAAFELPPAPAPGVKDLRGRAVRLCSFPDQSQADVHFFFPKRSVPFLNDMIKAVRVHIQKRGGKLARIVITPEDYARWIEKAGAADTEALRYQFATLLPHVE